MRPILIALVVGAMFFATGNAMAHNRYCDHSQKRYIKNGTVNRAVFHHQDKFQGEHWHFYLHDRAWNSIAWFTLHGYWRRCE